MLQTKWKSWDKYLNRFVGKRVNILELGVFKGEAMKWFLDNLMSHKESTYTGVDTFEGSPEYFMYTDPENNMINFKEVKKECFSIINKSNKKDRILIIEKDTQTALYDLFTKENKKNYYDIIFIDASHESIDVISDSILSWNLLKEDGILIEDDYWWDALDQEHFRPKISIDSFIVIYKSQLDVLYKGRQVIFRKKKKSEFELPKSNPMIKLVKNIQKYKQETSIFKFETKEKESLHFNLEFSKNIDSYTYLYKNHETLKKIIDMSLIKHKENINILDNLFMYNFFHKYMIPIFSNFYKNIIHKNEFIDNIQLLYSFNNQHLWVPNFEQIYLINLPKKKKIRTFNIVHNLLPRTKKETYNDVETPIFNKYILNIKGVDELDKYDLYVDYEYNKNNKTLNENKHLIFSDVRNSTDILTIEKKLQYKMDYIHIGLSYFIKNNTHNTKDIYYIQSLLNSIALGLTIQEKNGCGFYFTYGIYSIQSLQCVEIIRNYYENVELIKLESANNKSLSYYIKAEKFRGITKLELNNLYKIIDIIYNKNNSIGRNLNNYNYIINILENKIDDNIILELTKFNDIRIKESYNKYMLINDIYKVVYGSDLKNSNIIKNELLKKQFSDFIYFIKKIKLSN